MKKLNLFDYFDFKNWRFLQLCIFLIALIFVGPYIKSVWLMKILTSIVFLNSVLVVFSTDDTPARFRKYFIITWVTSVIIYLLSLLVASEGVQLVLTLVESLTGSMLLFILMYEILVYIFRKKELTVDSVFATFSVYLMIAVLFSQFYTFLYNYNPGSFKFPEDGLHDSGGNPIFYFSMVTIATLGYGDVLPVSNIARMLSVMEAIIGQFYVAVVVAIVVSKLITKKQ